MLSSLRNAKKPSIPLLLVLAVLVTRLTGAHWHLCTDGLEAPIGVHLYEPGLSDKSRHAAAAVHDLDLCISAEAVMHHTPLRLIPPFIVAIIWLIPELEPPAVRIIRAPPETIPIALREHRIPEPRGPPTPRPHQLKPSWLHRLLR